MFEDIEEEYEFVASVAENDYQENLEKLSLIYYRLTAEEEYMLNNLFKKYL